MGSLQEREVQRYYEPWLAAHGSSLNVAKHVESLAQLDLQRQGYSPQQSRDKAITAFAQIVAFRLDVRRCMVSLIDSQNQYILAEASNNPNDLWLGSAILSRPDAVCEHCLINTCSALEEDGRVYVAPGLIVNDCRNDSRFRDRSYVVQETEGVRFYAGVPIYSRNGYQIGACAISDVKPRDGLKADELRLLQETAQSAAEHLEWARDRVDRFKGERIVRGMASFIQDCTSMPEDPAPRRRTSTKERSASVPKSDSMVRMFHRAADILRESTLADGAAIFGATASSGPSTNIRMPQNGSERSTDPAPPRSPGSESDKHDTNTSDSDNAPAARPCKTLAFSLKDKQARDDIESGKALTLGTLEKYFSLFPQGRAFSFTDDGSRLSSEDDSASDREPPSKQSPDSAPDETTSTTVVKVRGRKRRMDHKELLKKIPGAKNVIFLPLYDHAEERLIAGCFLWTSVTGRMMTLDQDLSYLQAFGNCIVSEVIRMNMQRNEAAKTTFIASMSHELRSPLHGILGAAEFLMDTASDAYQSGLITSISTCGRTLLDTLNHVLDYSKINKLGRTQLKKYAKHNRPINLASDSSLESLNLTADVDLGTLVEEVAEAVTAGHAFKRVSGSFDSLTHKKAGAGSTSSSGASTPQPAGEGNVSVLLDISPRRSWMVRIQPGALRRIIMNLLGNALKYTTSGFVAVSLRAQESLVPNNSKVNVLIRVVDSGKGMSESFQQDRLFVPFSQEDPFQPGTGLGLSIVKQIVDALGGSIDVRSQQGVGTEIDIHLSLNPAADGAVGAIDHEILSVAKQTKGLRMVLLDSSQFGKPRPPTHQFKRLEQTLSEVCRTWFGMQVSRAKEMNREDADIYLFAEPPPVEVLLEQHRRDGHDMLPKRADVPVIIVYMDAEEATQISREGQRQLRELNRVVEIIPQPCGPRKLARVLSHCLRRAEEVRSGRSLDENLSGDLVGLHKEPSHKRPHAESFPSASSIKQPPTDPAHLGKDMSAAVSYPSYPLDPETPALLSPSPQPITPEARNAPAPAPPPQTAPPDSNALHILIVDDNKINRQLLVMFMKKCKFTYAEAENGQEAVDLFKSSCLPGPHEQLPPTNAFFTRRFDFVLMDVSMPIMDGFEACRCIRDFERDNGLRRTSVIALTGLASADAQREAETAGMDLFLPKPVKFKELEKLLNANASKKEKA